MHFTIYYRSCRIVFRRGNSTTLFAGNLVSCHLIFCILQLFICVLLVKCFIISHLAHRCVSKNEVQKTNKVTYIICSKPHLLGTEKQWRSIYYFYGVGMPVIFLIILLIAENAPGNHIRPNMGQSKCWFEGK